MTESEEDTFQRCLRRAVRELLEEGKITEERAVELLKMEGC